MLGWWRKRSRRAKGRLIFYPSLVSLAVAFFAFTMVMPGRSHHGGLPPLGIAGEARAARLRSDVTLLVGEDVERSQRAAGTLERTAGLIESALRETEYPVARLPVARALNAGKHAPARTVRFVAFVNEEPPYFWNAEMGSLVYARSCRARGDDVVAMLSLETLGYYRDAPGTQKYPPIVSWFYPDRGDFVAFVGNLGSRSVVRDAIRTFRGAVAFPSEGAALPSFVAGVGWSDQWSFWQVGYPGVMVTDTAPFRNPHYHQPGDVPATLDYARMARVTEGLVAVVKKLAE